VGCMLSDIKLKIIKTIYSKKTQKPLNEIICDH
jgi:hypothetical protein